MPSDVLDAGHLPKDIAPGKADHLLSGELCWRLALLAASLEDLLSVGSQPGR